MRENIVDKIILYIILSLTSLFLHFNYFISFF